MVIFSARPGQVAVLPDKGIPAQIRPQNWGGFASYRAVITQVQISRRCNVQFLHTLRNFIYVYSFGDRVSDLTISGIAFLDSCEGLLSGLDGVEAFYAANRVSVRGLPLVVAFGSLTVLQAHLVGEQNGIADSQTGLGQFSLQLQSVRG